MNMKIPASFKVGIIEYKVYLTERIEMEESMPLGFCKKFKNEGMLFGLCDPSAQTIWLATKDIQGNDLSQQRIVSTFYHEVAHALVGETAYQEANQDEVFIEALGKNLYTFCTSISDEEATLYVEDDNDEEKEDLSEVKVTSKKKTKK